MNEELQRIYNELKSLAQDCERITSGNVSHRIGNVFQGILSTAELIVYLSSVWKTTDELPETEMNEQKDLAKSKELVFITKDEKLHIGHYCFIPGYFDTGKQRFFDGDKMYQLDQVKYWILPPENEKRET